eukprot:gb/GEZN01001077.1/.p1 GENE.gb/GEZN01001077.1/~~gb/GEZN01001077.1/.p1  ORF type:complete len:987 (+),score=267.20 gb/GEZN01001077.1/:287-2962(+)
MITDLSSSNSELTKEVAEAKSDATKFQRELTHLKSKMALLMIGTGRIAVDGLPPSSAREEKEKQDKEKQKDKDKHDKEEKEKEKEKEKEREKEKEKEAVEVALAAEASLLATAASAAAFAAAAPPLPTAVVATVENATTEKAIASREASKDPEKKKRTKGRRASDPGEIFGVDIFSITTDQNDDAPLLRHCPTSPLPNYEHMQEQHVQEQVQEQVHEGVAVSSLEDESQQSVLESNPFSFQDADSEHADEPPPLVTIEPTDNVGGMGKQYQNGMLVRLATASTGSVNSHVSAPLHHNHTFRNIKASYSLPDLMSLGLENGPKKASRSSRSFMRDVDSPQTRRRDLGLQDFDYASPASIKRVLPDRDSKLELKETLSKGLRRASEKSGNNELQPPHASRHREKLISASQSLECLPYLYNPKANMISPNPASKTSGSGLSLTVKGLPRFDSGSTPASPNRPHFRKIVAVVQAANTISTGSSSVGKSSHTSNKGEEAPSSVAFWNLANVQLHAHGRKASGITPTNANSSNSNRPPQSFSMSLPQSSSSASSSSASSSSSSSSSALTIPPILSSSSSPPHQSCHSPQGSPGVSSTLFFASSPSSANASSHFSFPSSSSSSSSTIITAPIAIIPTATSPSGLFSFFSSASSSPSPVAHSSNDPNGPPSPLLRASTVGNTLAPPNSTSAPSRSGQRSKAVSSRSPPVGDRINFLPSADMIARNKSSYPAPTASASPSALVVRDPSAMTLANFTVNPSPASPTGQTHASFASAGSGGGGGVGMGGGSGTGARSKGLSQLWVPGQPLSVGRPDRSFQLTPAVRTMSEPSNIELTPDLAGSSSSSKTTESPSRRSHSLQRPVRDPATTKRQLEFQKQKGLTGISGVSGIVPPSSPDWFDS